MKIITKVVLGIAIIWFGMGALSFSVHADEGKSINVCISEDDSIFLDRILRYGLEELGYDVSITSQKMLPGIVGVNEGQFDALGIQSAGLEEQYSNLVMVPEAVGDVEFCVYIREGENISASGWRDLQGLSVGIEYQRPYIQESLSGITGVTVTEYTSKEEALRALARGEVEVTVFPQIFGMKIYLPSGIEAGGTVEKQACYTYLNREKENLAPVLAAKYKTMKNSGKMKELIAGQSPVEDNKSVVLHISSYNNDIKAEEALNQGLRKSLEQYDSVELYNISLNANLRENQEIRARMFGDMLRSDFATRPPDVIVVSDSYALDFLKEYYFRLFENVPVIINGMPGMEYQGFGRNVVYVEKKIAVGETVDELLKLFPGTREIYVINDRLKDGLLWEAIMQEELKGRQDVSIRYSGDISFDELLNEIKNLPKHTVILSGTYYGGISKKHYSGKEIQKMFEAAYNVPVFSCNLTGFGEGELGGKYINKEEIGQYIGELAVQLAEGRQASDIAVDPERVRSTWFFDNNQMIMWGIGKTELPRDAVLINTAMSFRELNPSAYYLAIVAFIAGSIAIVVLGWSVYQTRKKNIRLQNLQKTLVEAEQVIEKDRIIRKVNEKLETIIASAPLAYAVADKDGVILETNRYAIENIGFQIGENIMDYDRNTDSREIRVAEMIQEGMMTGGILSYHMREGDWERFYVNVSSYEDSGEKRYIVWATNVEELQSQRDAYRRTQRDLKQIVDALPWPMCIVGPRDVSVYYGNDAFKDCFRFEMESAEEYCMWKIVPEYQSNGETSREKMRKFIEKVLSVQASVTEEQEFVLPTGEVVLMRTVGTEIDYNGNPSVSMVLQDISAQKCEEELLRSLALKEREANELKSKFIVNMSHEIRTPMNAIIGLSDIQLQKTHNAEIRDTFKKISMSAKLLLAMVNDILDYSKIEADKLGVTREEFVLENIIYEAMLTAFTRINEKKVEMLFKLSGRVPRKVIGDAVRVWQILQNVLDNSAKYTSKGSVVLEVSLESEELHQIEGEELHQIEGEDQQMILFRIADTGIGMNKKQLDMIYVPFEQFDRNDLQSGGTGLGMPITKQLVKIMGGTIEIESQEGIGTVTEIRIPFGISEWQEPVIDENAYEILKNKDILIVDEAVVGAQVAAGVLSDIGARPESISQIEDVIRRVQEFGRQGREFDILVLDQNADKDLLKALRSYPFVKTKMITIRKPYKPTEFLERLCALLGGVPQASKYRNKKYHFPKARILICEDNAINQEVITGVLGLYDIQSVVAVNGAEGIKWLDKESFDLVIMDILMPVMDGHQTTRAIRSSQKSYRDIPIVAMTANAMKEEMAACLEEGMNGYVTKPIDLERLYNELLKWLPVSVREEGVDMMAQNAWQDTEREDNLHTQKVELERLQIDIEEATTRFGGKYELYCKSLRKFAVDIVKNGMMDSEEAEQEEPEELRKHIHSLKGVTANLSMKELNLMLQKMEKTIKEGAPDMELYRQFCERMMEVSRSIEEITDSGQQKSDSEVGNWDECKELLIQLKEFLLLAKAKECEQIVLCLREKKWDNVDTELLEKICSSVEEYDYAKTLSILGKLL